MEKAMCVQGQGMCECCVSLPLYRRWSAYRTGHPLTHCEATGAHPLPACTTTTHQVHACNDQLASALQESRMRRGLPGDDDRGRAERAAGDPAPVGLGGEAEEAWKPHAVAIAHERLRLQVRVQSSLCLSCIERRPEIHTGAYFLRPSCCRVARLLNR